VVGVECLELLVNSFFKGTFRNPDLDGFCPAWVERIRRPTGNSECVGGRENEQRF
jgi:hypothetical protein